MEWQRWRRAIHSLAVSFSFDIHEDMCFKIEQIGFSSIARNTEKMRMRN